MLLLLLLLQLLLLLLLLVLLLLLLLLWLLLGGLPGCAPVLCAVGPHGASAGPRSSWRSAWAVLVGIRWGVHPAGSSLRRHCCACAQGLSGKVCSGMVRAAGPRGASAGLRSSWRSAWAVLGRYWRRLLP